MAAETFRVGEFTCDYALFQAQIDKVPEHLKNLFAYIYTGKGEEDLAKTGYIVRVPYNGGFVNHSFYEGHRYCANFTLPQVGGVRLSDYLNEAYKLDYEEEVLPAAHRWLRGEEALPYGFTAKYFLRQIPEAFLAEGAFAPTPPPKPVEKTSPITKMEAHALKLLYANALNQPVDKREMWILERIHKVFPIHHLFEDLPIETFLRKGYGDHGPLGSNPEAWKKAVTYVRDCALWFRNVDRPPFEVDGFSLPQKRFFEEKEQLKPAAQDAYTVLITGKDSDRIALLDMTRGEYFAAHPAGNSAIGWLAPALNLFGHEAIPTSLTAAYFKEQIETYATLPAGDLETMSPPSSADLITPEELTAIHNIYLLITTVEDAGERSHQVREALDALPIEGFNNAIYGGIFHAHTDEERRALGHDDGEWGKNFVAHTRAKLIQVLQEEVANLSKARLKALAESLPEAPTGTVEL